MLLIFDCDGVVVDSTLLHTEAEAGAFRKLGMPLTQSEFVERFSGTSDADMFRILESETGITIPVDMKIRLDKEKKELFTQKLKAMQGLRGVLEDMHHIPSCIASSSSVDMLNYMLSLTDIVDFFKSRIFSSEMVTRGKPFPDLFLYAASQMGEQPENSIVIEDSVVGVHAGKAAGCKVIGFVGGSHCDNTHGAMLVEAGADYILSSMSGLPSIITTINSRTLKTA